ERMQFLDVWVVRPEARRPIARFLRVAAHEIEPALGLESELPGSFHVAGLADGELVDRLTGRAVVVRLGAALRSCSLARPNPDQIEVLDRYSLTAELVLRLGVHQDGF